MIPHERIAHFLSAGLKPAQVASIVGCTPSYISQLQAQEDFQALLDQQASSEVPAPEDQEAALLDAKYLALEHRVLNQLEAVLPMAETREVIGVLRTISDRQVQRERTKQQAKMPVPQQPAVQIAVLTLPSHALPAYQVNEQNQIVAIDQKPMASLSSTSVKSMFDQMRALQPLERILE